MTGFRRIEASGAACLLAVVLIAASCGGGSATPDGAPTGSAGTGGGAGSNGNTPVGQCKDVVTTLCNRDNQCNMLNSTPADMMSCVAANNVAFGCDRAAMPFTDCLTDVKAVSCSALFPAAGPTLPASCDDPINAIPLSTPQQKCADLANAVCERSAGCQGITPTPTQLQNCQADVFAQLGCLYAIDVSPMFMQCLTDLAAAPCPPQTDGGVSDAGADGGSIPSCSMPITFVQ